MADQGRTDLSAFNNEWYQPGPAFKRLCWYMCNALFFLNPWFPLSGIKVRLLRVFGAKVGRGVVIKPRVNIKYPWKLSIGAHAWIGEQVWIDNLAEVSIGAHACISQGAMLLCGNHNYKKPAFDLIVRPIVLEDGAWVGAQSVVCPGVRVGSHALLAVGSVATKDLPPYTIHQGNPAQYVKDRVIQTAP